MCLHATPGGGVARAGDTASRTPKRLPYLRNVRAMIGFGLCMLTALACADGGIVSLRPDTEEGLLPSTIEIAGGNDQEGPVGAFLENSLLVLVRDSSGTPVPGATVRFTLESGKGTDKKGAPPASVVDGLTGADGFASMEWELGTRAGLQQAWAELPSAESPSATANGAEPAPPEVNGKRVGFRARARAGLPATIVVEPASLGLTVGDSAAVVAFASDRYGNTIDGATVELRSGDASVVSVGPTAPAMAVGATAGTTTISASYDGLSTSADVSVEDAGNESVMITTAALPDGYVGWTYDVTLGVEGAAGPVAWSLESGALPEGLTLEAGSGRISGTPVNTATTTFTVRVASGTVTDASTFTLAVLPTGGDQVSNEPPGMTEIFYMDGTTKDWGPLIDMYGVAWGDPSEGSAGPFTGNVSVVDDPDAPNGRAVQQDWPVGRGSGFNGVPIMDWTDEFGYQSELYIRLGFRYSQNWQQHSGVDKIFYYGAGSTGTATEFFPAIRGGGQTLTFRNQSGSSDNAMFGSTRRIVWGRYHMLEIHHVANSSPGVADGRLRVWLDGQLILEWDDYSDGLNQLVDLDAARWEWIGAGESRTGFKGGQFAPYWGGSNDVKAVADWFRWGELYISGKPQG